MSLSRESAAFLLEMVGKLQLSAGDPQIVEAAQLVARVKAELTAIVEED